jgi:hypothetical protein
MKPLLALLGLLLAGGVSVTAAHDHDKAVVMSWQDNSAHHVALEMLDHPGVPTPVGSGDRFLAEWIFFRETWSRQGQLREPIAANGVRTTHAVVQSLGLRRGDYDVRVLPL